MIRRYQACEILANQASGYFVTLRRASASIASLLTVQAIKGEDITGLTIEEIRAIWLNLSPEEVKSLVREDEVLDHIDPQISLAKEGANYLKGIGWD